MWSLCRYQKRKRNFIIAHPWPLLTYGLVAVFFVVVVVLNKIHEARAFATYETLSDFLFLFCFCHFKMCLGSNPFRLSKVKWKVLNFFRGVYFSDWVFSARSCPALRAFAWLNLIKPSVLSFLWVVCNYFEHTRLYYLCSTSICLDLNHNRKMNWAYWPVTTLNVWVSIKYTWKYLFLATFCLLPSAS